MKDRFVIRRRVRHSRERTMYIVREPGSVGYRIDPQREVSEATGILTKRGICVESFACGLQAAGYEVEIDQTVPGGGRQIRLRFWKPLTVTCVYYFLGLCWGLGQWNRLRDSLQQVLPEYRFAVLERTAVYYLERPEEQDIQLLV